MHVLVMPQGIGCYMFGIANTDLVIDGTMKGGHARFINHSCEVGCGVGDCLF